jgi:hypothetical protein
VFTIVHTNFGTYADVEITTTGDLADRSSPPSG